MNLYTKEGQIIHLTYPCPDCPDDDEVCGECEGRGYFLTDNGYTILEFVKKVCK